MKWEGYERKQLWLGRDTVREFAWSDLGIPPKISIRIANIRAEIRN
jgi:hypothetical protein